MAILPGASGTAPGIMSFFRLSCAGDCKVMPYLRNKRRPVGGRTLQELSRVVQVFSPHPLSKRVPVRGAVFLVFNVDIPPVSKPSEATQRHWGIPLTHPSRAPDVGARLESRTSQMWVVLSLVFRSLFVSFMAGIPPVFLPQSCPLYPVCRFLPSRNPIRSLPPGGVVRPAP